MFRLSQPTVSCHSVCTVKLCCRATSGPSRVLFGCTMYVQQIDSVHCCEREVEHAGTPLEQQLADSRSSPCEAARTGRVLVRLQAPSRWQTCWPLPAPHMFCRINAGISDDSSLSVRQLLAIAILMYRSVSCTCTDLQSWALTASAYNLPHTDTHNVCHIWHFTSNVTHQPACRAAQPVAI